MPLYPYASGTADLSAVAEDVLFAADGSYDIGASAASRPDAVHAVSLLAASSAMALGTSPSESYGILLRNSSPAAAGAQQVSPPIYQGGSGWKTDATAAAQNVTFRQLVTPVQGTAAPTGYWSLAASIAGGAYTDLVRISSAGTITMQANGNIVPAASGNGNLGGGSAYWSALYANSVNCTAVAASSYLSAASYINLYGAHALGVTPNDTTGRLLIGTSTLATGGATVQISPSLRFYANVWNTAANEAASCRMYLLPASAAQPTGELPIQFDFGGDGYATSHSIKSSGVFRFVGNFATAGAPSGEEGDLAYCTDGDTGAKCLAFYDGSNWLRIALGAAIAAS